MSELNLILLGPPGSGKGTQGERLQEDFDLPYYATGDILRAAVREGTEIGTKAKEYMDRGDLVPDDVIVGVIAERIDQNEAEDGFILDGFPRTEPQAEALGEKLAELGRGVSAAVLIEVDDEEVVRRLGGRRTCPNGAHLPRRVRPPEEEGVCDVCGEPLSDPRRRQARGDPPPPRAVSLEDRAADRLLRRQGPAEARRRRPAIRRRSPKRSARSLATLAMEEEA